MSCDSGNNTATSTTLRLLAYKLWNLCNSDLSRRENRMGNGTRYDIDAGCTRQYRVTGMSDSSPTTPMDVRQRLVEALRLDLIGPGLITNFLGKDFQTLVAAYGRPLGT